MVKLKSFLPFGSAGEALSNANDVSEGEFEEGAKRPTRRVTTRERSEEGARRIRAQRDSVSSERSENIKRRRRGISRATASISSEAAVGRPRRTERQREGAAG
jgi:hypothetical protein